MVLTRVREIIAERLGITNLSEITTETSLIHDLDLEPDSVDTAEIIMSIDDEFDVEIPDEIADGFKTVGNIVDYIEKNI